MNAASAYILAAVVESETMGLVVFLIIPDIALAILVSSAEAQG